jgi:hypothetical protein
MTVKSLHQFFYYHSKYLNSMKCREISMDLSIPKCALTGSPNQTKMNRLTFKALLQIKNISFRNQPIPVLHQNEQYLYLGIL